MVPLSNRIPFSLASKVSSKIFFNEVPMRVQELITQKWLLFHKKLESLE